MCGIAGVMGRAPRAPDCSQVDRVVDALAHRGPDGRGVMSAGAASLGHRRLSIIDLEGGAQPIGSPRGDLIVVNGEIYNDLEIRKACPDRPYLTKSDSESALALYEKYGLEFVDHLRGMYAIAIYDKAREQLVLHRDPYGIKPLYYRDTGDAIWFSSEPQALFAAQNEEPKLNAAKVIELMQLRFNTGADTVFSNVRSLLPGETLVVRGGRIAERRRRDPFTPRKPMEIDEDTALRELHNKLLDSVETHMRSDAPYGVFLSGGVDSCSVIAAMERLGVRGLPCYTAAFPGTSVSSEADRAARVAEAIEAEHITVDVTEHDFWRVLPEVARKVDDPSLDAAMVPMHLLAERAAKDVKVVLCGQGGDEIFAGYRRYERAGLPSFLPMRQLRKKGWFDGSRLSDFCKQPWRDDYAQIADLKIGAAETRLMGLQALDGSDYLPNHNLRVLDRCLMAHGLEGRTPFLDPVLSSFGFSLPDRLKLRGRVGKWLLRTWLNNHLPVAEPFADKRGFSVPLGEWIEKRTPHLAEFMCDQAGVRQLFDVDQVRLLFTQARHCEEARRWPLLFFAIWHQIHFTRGPVPNLATG